MIDGVLVVTDRTSPDTRRLTEPRKWPVVREGRQKEILLQYDDDDDHDVDADDEDFDENDNDSDANEFASRAIRQTPEQPTFPKFDQTDNHWIFCSK